MLTHTLVVNSNQFIVCVCVCVCYVMILRIEV